MLCGVHGGREEGSDCGASRPAGLGKNKHKCTHRETIDSVSVNGLWEGKDTDKMPKTKQASNESNEPSFECSNSIACWRECE